MQENSADINTAHMKQHGLIAKVFHWGFILVFAYGLSKQLSSLDELRDTSLLHFEMIFAKVFLILLAVRYFYMRTVGPTALPDNTSIWMKRAARAGHLAMYISLAMIAISGIAIGALYMHGNQSGSLIGAVIEWHEFSVMASYISIALHISAALFHRWLGDGIWSSMVPFFKEKPTTVTKVDGL